MEKERLCKEAEREKRRAARRTPRKQHNHVVAMVVIVIIDLKRDDIKNQDKDDHQMH